MDASSDEALEISDFELDEYEEDYYMVLKAGNHKIRNPDGTFRCPFCAGKKQDYLYKDLLQHTISVGASNSRRAKEKATHWTFAKYLKTDLADAAGPSQPLHVEEEQHTLKPGHDELFVWPWIGVLINVLTEEGRFKLEEQLSDFHPIDVILLGEGIYRIERRGVVVVRFNKDWSGFKDAMAFENHFKVSYHGKNDWNERVEDGSEMYYGWIARDDDYNTENIVGHHLKRHGELRTISNVAKEESKETDKIVVIIADQIKVKNKLLVELEVEVQCDHSIAKSNNGGER